MSIASRGAAAALVCVLVSSAGSVRADDDVPALPIRDLPPFPDIDEPEVLSEASVYGATLADEETVVGASKREQSLGTVASAVTVLTSDLLRRYGYRTLAEALRGVGGLYIVDDRMVERIGVRGVQVLGDANTRILILIDSTPLNEPWSQFVDGSTALPVSLDDVARLEIIRGPVSSIYGTNAFLGIINIVTIEADKAPRGYGRLTSDTFGTFGGNAAFNAGTINQQARGSVSFTKRFGENLDYPELGATDADGAHSVFGSLALTFNRFFFQARGYERKRQLPGAPYNSDFGSSLNANRDRHFLAELGYTHEFSKKLTVAARAYANRYTFDSRLALTGTDFSTDASSLWYGGEVRALADLLKTPGLLTSTAGVAVELTQTSSQASAAGSQVIDKNFNIAGVYVDAATAPNKWFGASVGARFDRNSEFTSKLSPRAALFLHQGEAYGLKLLYAEGFRNPSIFEAYYDDEARFAPSLDSDDRTNLSPETIRSYEVVVYGKKAIGSANLKFRLSFWEWRMKNLIQRRVINDPDSNPPGQQRVQFQNIGALVSRGAELEATYRDVSGRAAYANLTGAFTGQNCFDGDGFANLLLDEDEGSCDPRVNSPTVVAKAGMSSQLIMELFHASGEVSFVSSRQTQDGDETLPAWVGLNLVAYLPDVKGFDVTVGARNLIGREHVPAQSEYNRSDPAVKVLEIPGPGRELFARLGRRF